MTAKETVVVKAMHIYLKIILGGVLTLHSKISLCLTFVLLKIQREENFIAFAQKNSQYHLQKVYSYSLLKRLLNSGPTLLLKLANKTLLNCIRYQLQFLISCF